MLMDRKLPLLAQCDCQASGRAAFDQTRAIPDCIRLVHNTQQNYRRDAARCSRVISTAKMQGAEHERRRPGLELDSDFFLSGLQN